MTNTTETYWDVDGVSLQTYAYNITTLGGSRTAPTTVRGNDLNVPYMPGSIFQPKVPESRTIPLAMWVTGANPDGTIPRDSDARREYDRNWRMLRKLLWRPRKQFTLTKRMWVHEDELDGSFYDYSNLPQFGDFRLLTVHARASFAAGLEPTMNGEARATFTVTLLLNDPYFYGDPVTIPFTTAAKSQTNAGPTQKVTILGDDDTTAVKMDFVGPLTTPRFTVTTPDNATIWTQYGNVIAQNEHATIDADTWTGTHYLTGSNYKAAGYVTHQGSIFWTNLVPGDNTIALSKQAGTGTATLTYTPVWW